MNIIIIGASGHGKVVASIVEQEGKYSIAGFIDGSRDIGSKIVGYEVVGREEDLPRLMQDRTIEGIIVAIGDNFTRSKVTDRIRSLCPSLKFVSTIHPNAFIGREVIVGDGSVIMSGAVVHPCSTIGKSCILFVNSVLDHDSSMGNYSSLGHNASTGGNCHIGDYTAVCIGANVIHGITVGDHSVVGGGAAVIRNIDCFAVAHGIPAKAIRKREIGDKYL